MLNTRQYEKLEQQAIVAALFRLCDPLRMSDLKRGDTVQLKSGGPIMTINLITGDGTVLCQWFDNDSALKQGTFNQEQLRKAEPEKEWRGEGLNL